MRRRISWLVIATTSAVVVSFVAPLCLLVRTVAEDRAMGAADQEARSVAILVSRFGTEGQLAEVVGGVDSGVPVTTVVAPGGAVVGQGDATADDEEVRRAMRGEAFTVVDDAGGRVLLPVVTREGTAVVHTSVAPEDLRRGVAAAWAGLVALGVLLILAGVVVADRLARRISEPLLGVADVAHRLRGGDLSARAELGGPEETEELARALNGLAERTAELLREERLAVADLSHRLRTPVTALRLDAEAVADPDLARRIDDHIVVLQRGIDAIVHEARRPVRTDLPARTDVVPVVRERFEHWGALADDQGRRAELSVADGSLYVAVARDDLVDLVDVLIDNVFAHTPEPAGFAVRLERNDRVVRLVVEDEGGGVVRPRVTRSGSTGLGLDIARRTAASCGGHLSVGPRPGGGTRVEVELPVLDD